MKVTLTYDCSSYEESAKLEAHLTNCGYHAICCSPYNHKYQVLVSSTPQTVNIGYNVWDELESAEREIDKFMN